MQVRDFTSTGGMRLLFKSSRRQHQTTFQINHTGQPSYSSPQLFKELTQWPRSWRPAPNSWRWEEALGSHVNLLQQASWRRSSQQKNKHSLRKWVVQSHMVVWKEFILKKPQPVWVRKHPETGYSSETLHFKLANIYIVKQLLLAVDIVVALCNCFCS